MFKFSIWIFLFYVECVYKGTLADQKSFLIPELGVKYSQGEDIVISPHAITLNFLIPFDKINLTELNVPHKLSNICSDNQKSKYVKLICKHQFENVEILHNLTLEWEEDLKILNEDLMDLIENDKLNKQQNNIRKDRGLASLAMSVLSWGASTGIKTYLDYKRQKDIMNGMKMLQNKQTLNSKAIISVKNDMAHFIRLDLSQKEALFEIIENMGLKVSELENNLINLQRNLVNVTDEINSKIQTIPLLSKFVEIKEKFGVLVYSRLPRLYNQEHRLLENLRSAQKGILNHGLIDKQKLIEAINHAKEVLLEWSPDFTILATDVNKIYQHSRVHIQVSEIGATVQLALELKQKSTPFLRTFHFETIPVPLNDTSDLATKIVTDTSIVAVSDSHYVSMSQKQYENCEILIPNDLKVCHFTLPLVRREIGSCLINLLDNKPKQMVYQSCPVQLNTFEQWGPSMISSEHAFLIFGVAQEHQIFCDNDKIPQNYENLKYAYIRL